MSSSSLYQQIMLALIHEARVAKTFDSIFDELILGRDEWSANKQRDLCREYPAYARKLLVAYVNNIFDEVDCEQKCGTLNTIEHWPSCKRSQHITKVAAPVVRFNLLEALTCPEQWIRQLAQQIHKEQNNVEQTGQL